MPLLKRMNRCGESWKPVVVLELGKAALLGWRYDMGAFTVRIGVSNGNGGATQWVEALVDTGATFTVLPASVLRERVGVQPAGQMRFTFADGREALLPVGEAVLRIDGQQATNRVVFGEEGQYLLGATTLQVLGLIPDTSSHRLVPAPKLLI